MHKIEKQRSLKLYDRYYLEAQQERNTIKNDIGIQNDIENAKKQSLDKIDRILIAEEIAKGKDNNASDRIKALDYLSKIEGDYAAVRQEVTAKIASIKVIRE